MQDCQRWRNVIWPSSLSYGEMRQERSLAHFQQPDVQMGRAIDPALQRSICSGTSAQHHRAPISCWG
jgi:hypothetical protein